MKSIPTISKFMTTTPLTIERNSTLAQAEKFMHTNKIRHLPVVEGEKIFGILSDRDVHTFMSFKGVDPNQEIVESVCTKDPYIVGHDTKLDEVCREMAKNKYGSVLVQDNKKIVGIFTWIDALKAMTELLETRLK